MVLVAKQVWKVEFEKCYMGGERWEVPSKGAESQYNKKMLPYTWGTPDRTAVQ